MPIKNKRFSVLVFCWRSVHISCADRTALGPCEAVRRVGRDPDQPIFQPSPAELSYRVLAVSGSTKWMCCWWVRWDSHWSPLPCGGVRPCGGHEIIQSRELQKPGERDKNYSGIKALVREQAKVSGGSWERVLNVLLSQERISMLYLSVPWAHILIKHKSTDLEHVMTK